jgi:hypothetical protein
VQAVFNILAGFRRGPGGDTSDDGLGRNLRFGMLTLKRLWTAGSKRTHHMLGPAFGFLFVLIAGRADDELGLDQASDGAVAMGALEGEDTRGSARAQGRPAGVVMSSGRPAEAEVGAASGTRCC